ncbi:non-canonical purine NTP diphosphatase [Limibacter armeniacum]|uniref:non-canonical purine NTP diphosphatase n=1 Tax=Limibacter armeniacum TaxID=466084 RepID=UPI002FE5E1EA
MIEICFATNNPNKLKEISLQLEGKFKVVSLSDIGCHEDIPEEQPTIEGNSKQKAAYIWDNYKVNCFADDTGLEVEALNGEPGVLSARYAGPQKDSNDNIDLLLENLKGKSERNAQFKTVITLVIDGTYHQFEGIAKGEIIEERTGDQGFGYDPIFKPNGYEKTFAQISLEEKNSISHRGKAVKKLVEFLSSL